MKKKWSRKLDIKKSKQKSNIEFAYSLFNGLQIEGDKESVSGKGHVRTLEYLKIVHLPCQLHG
jgi:hypothetical protein